jgi:uncharacterized protein YndB with AHSA1/START domain
MTETAQSTIERRLMLNASQHKVWNAIATPEGFAGWFLARVEGVWAAGKSVILNWPSGSKNEIYLVAIEPESHFAYQWHPGGLFLLADHPTSELTTVSMKLRDVEGRTELHLLETGFDNVPDERRLSVLGMNSAGWDEETENIRKYVEA